MKIIENIWDLPTKAGDAELVLQPPAKDRYYYDNHAPVTREGNKIALLNDRRARFYSIKDGQQFLFTLPDPRHGDENRRLFFGGTDEMPFLVELELAALEGLIGGEEAFFEGLKPSKLRNAERNLNNKTKRQGDFFAVGPKVNAQWKNFFVRNLKGNKFSLSLVEDQPLLDTRHTFSGLLASTEGYMVGEGTITAPDHEPLVLKGPHVIIQAQYLMRPKEAD
jgi:hypothetical protein